MYWFIDGFFGYHHIRIAKEDRHDTTIVTEWGCFQYTVIPFGLKKAPAIFSRIIVVSFKDFIHKFLEVYFDDWTIFGFVKYHIKILRMMLERCCQYQISLILNKCIFCTHFGAMLVHVVCRDEILVDPTEIVIILSLPPPTIVK